MWHVNEYSPAKTTLSENCSLLRTECREQISKYNYFRPNAYGDYCKFIYHLPSGIASEASICVPRILASSSSNSWRKARNLWGIERWMANGEDMAVRK